MSLGLRAVCRGASLPCRFNAERIRAWRCNDVQTCIELYRTSTMLLLFFYNNKKIKELH